MNSRSDAAPIGSLWAATATTLTPLPELDAPIRAEVAVIGGGYTGLSAALHLAEQGHDAALIEARAIGEGASGLNGGQVIAGVKFDPDELQERYGGELGARTVATVGAAPELVFELIAKHRIECDAVRNGWIQAGPSESDLGGMRSRVEQWRRRGADVALLDRAATAQLTGTHSYRCAWIDRRGGTLQPLSYARGLAQAAQRAGSRLFSHSPATRLSRSGADWHIETPRGSVTARMVVLATDAYTDGLVDPLRRSLVMVPSFQVATTPLPPSLRVSILPQRHSVSDTGPLLRYFRLDAGGRLLMGSRGAFDRTANAESARHLHRAVWQMFPALRDIGFEYHWSGLVAITADRLPHLHRLAPGLLAGVGYNGRGVAMATTMGRLLAQLAAGASDEALGFPITELRPMRLHRFARLAARATMQYLQVRDRIARRRAA